jgi:IS605 OrfB family transposase
MTRAVQISLGLATGIKRRRLLAIIREYRAAANFYARSLWQEKGGLDAATLRRYKGSSIACHFRSDALKFALETVILVKKSAREVQKKASCPVFKRAVRVSGKVFRIKKGRGSFDYVASISSFVPWRPVRIPFKSHARLNYWLQRGGRILDGAILSADGSLAWVYVRLPDAPLKEAGETIGLDTGFTKLLADSNGRFHGVENKTICASVRRKKPGSQGKLRAKRRRKQFIDSVCKSLPWQTTKTFVLEDLTGLKTGKGNRGKRNRKLLAPWSYRQVRSRLTSLAQENRVCLELVDPKFTSRTCPKCRSESAKNRVGEKFSCITCNYQADADHVGAMNVLANTTRNCPQPLVAVAASGSTEPTT